MNPYALHPHPRWRDVLRAQLRATAIGNRREMVAIGLLLAIVMLAHLPSGWMTGGEPFEFDLTEVVLPVMILAALAPMAVWKGQEPSRRAYFWAMPVGRSRHTLVKVLGGWVWLMALIPAFLLWALALALVTGGDIGLGADRAEFLLRDFTEGARLLDPTFFGNPWMWLVPFTGATAAYLLGTIVVLSSEHPWRWFVGVPLGFWFLVEAAGQEWLVRLVGGRHGLEAVFLGLSDQVLLVPGDGGAPVERVINLPDPNAWVVATVIWTALAAAGVWGAAHRFQER